MTRTEVDHEITLTGTDLIHPIFDVADLLARLEGALKRPMKSWQASAYFRKSLRLRTMRRSSPIRRGIGVISTQRFT